MLYLVIAGALAVLVPNCALMALQHRIFLRQLDLQYPSRDRSRDWKFLTVPNPEGNTK